MPSPSTCSNTSSKDITFGRGFAVLHLDLMSVLTEAVEGTPQGDAFVKHTVEWVEAVHQHNKRPLTIYTSLSFANSSHPELAPDAPFTRLLSGYGDFSAGNKRVQIDPRMAPQEEDIVLQKSRWYAGAGNSLETILSAKGIKTVVVCGLSLSAVVLSTLYRLFDLDYEIYIISDCVYELFSSDDVSAEAMRLSILQGLCKQMSFRVITKDQAVAALPA